MHTTRRQSVTRSSSYKSTVCWRACVMGRVQRMRPMSKVTMGLVRPYRSGLSAATLFVLEEVEGERCAQRGGRAYEET